jgi:paraquat-inducible protein B
VKTKVSPAIVGAFVIGAFAIGMIALLSFGSFHFFDKPQRFIVYFSESTHGLDIGSPVKLRGVRVGRVVAVSIRYDDTRNESVVAVVCEFSKDVVTDNKGGAIDVADPDELETLIKRGLRARLEMQSFATGLLYVGLDFLDPKENPIGRPYPDSKYPVVPFVPSTISEFQAGLTELLANLKRVDLAGLAKDLSAVANTARKQIEGVDLKGLAEQWKKTGTQLETLAANPEIKKTFENLNAAVADVRATVAKLDGQIEPTSKDFAKMLAEARTTLQAFNTTAATAQNFIATNSALGDELVTTLGQLSEAADAVKRLADYLERNPNALITGRKKPQ